MVSELEMTSHMWSRYTKNIIRFGCVEIHINKTLSIVNHSNGTETVICEFGRFSEESELINLVRKDVLSKGGRCIVKWGSSI